MIISQLLLSKRVFAEEFKPFLKIPYMFTRKLTHNLRSQNCTIDSVHSYWFITLAQWSTYCRSLVYNLIEQRNVLRIWYRTVKFQSAKCWYQFHGIVYVAQMTTPKQWNCNPCNDIVCRVREPIATFREQSRGFIHSV